MITAFIGIGFSKNENKKVNPKKKREKVIITINIL